MHMMLVGALALSVLCDANAKPSTRPADSVFTAASVRALQREPEDAEKGRYDWGPSVMYDDGLYRMWWTRLGGSGQAKRFTYRTTLPDGEPFEFTYPDWGDRVYYAESRDGLKWKIEGADYNGPANAYGPESAGAMLVLGPAESPQQYYHLACPSVIRVDGVFYCYVEACSEFRLTRGPDGRISVGNEYHNQVFVATSRDGRTWRQHPDDRDPQPILRAPAENKLPGRQRYGLGQPSVFYSDGTFVMHYVDSCTGPGDCVVRIEADNPFFRNARRVARVLEPPPRSPALPPGTVARFAQMDVKPFDKLFLLIRPTYEGNVNLLASTVGVFRQDAAAPRPAQSFPQVRLPDPRGEEYTDRLFPRFLTDAHGQVRLENNRLVVYYGSGRGWKSMHWTWDLYRAEIPLSAIARN